jgi:O-glycosyl hydrolase
MRTSVHKTVGPSVPGRAVLVALLAAALAAPGPAVAASQTPPPSWTVGVVQTTANLAQRLARLPDLRFRRWHPHDMPVIDVDDTVHYQPITGIGASMTDSSAWLIHDELSPQAGDQLLARLFGFGGIRLSFLRVPMGASDYILNDLPYTYDDPPHGQSDPTLSDFTIDHDLAYILPTLQTARRDNPDLDLLANPWSPPPWMKTNDLITNVEALGSLRASAYKALAQYFVRFLEAYADEGVRIDAITPQNEPASGLPGVSYPGLTLPEPDEAKFIAGDLSPALTKAHLNVGIYGGDLSWGGSDYSESLARTDHSDLAGIAWHCYFGTPTVMSQLHQNYPRMDQIADECSPEIRSFGTPEYLISSLRNWASAVAVWNLALDPQGGPKLPQNGCFGCTGIVTINEQTHTVTLRKKYFDIAQVSAFLRPGAVRIASNNFVSYGPNASDVEQVTPGLDDVAFLNPNGNRVLVAYDNSLVATTFAVAWHGRAFEYTLTPGTMVTFLWNPDAQHPTR